MLTIEQKRKICNYVNEMKTSEEGNGYLLKRMFLKDRVNLSELGVDEVSINRNLGCFQDLDVTNLLFLNNYADLLSDKGFIVFDEKIAIGEFLVGRVGAEVHVGKFEGDIYKSEIVDRDIRFNLTKLLVNAYYND